MNQLLMRVCVAAVALLPALSTAEPLAASLIGRWTCAPKDGGPSFTWLVSERLQGGWLIGEGFEDGVLTSLETWSFNPNGQLMDRRQFSPVGAYIQLSVVDRGSQTVSSEGRRTTRDGVSTAVRHRLHLLDSDAFEATWEANTGSGWTIVADEICSRNED